MRPIVVTVADASGGAVTSRTLPLDHYISPFNTSLAVTVTGTANYTVQYTFDRIQQPGWTPATGNWVDHPNLTAQTATKDSNLAYPAMAVRIILNSGTGSARFTVIQAGLA